MFSHFLKKVRHPLLRRGFVLFSKSEEKQSSWMNQGKFLRKLRRRTGINHRNVFSILTKNEFVKFARTELRIMPFLLTEDILEEVKIGSKIQFRQEIETNKDYHKILNDWSYFTEEKVPFIFDLYPYRSQRSRISSEFSSPGDLGQRIWFHFWSCLLLSFRVGTEMIWKIRISILHLRYQP